LPDKPPKRPIISPITRRILAINLFALGILVAGLLYLGEYRRGLIDAEIASLHTQAQLFAAAIGEGAVNSDSPTSQRLLEDVTRKMVRRMVETTHTRARLFAADGTLLADSRMLTGRGGAIQTEVLPPPEPDSPVAAFILNSYDRVVGLLPGREVLPPYQETPRQWAGDYQEVIHAIGGDATSVVRRAGSHLMLSVAVPVQRYKRVLGALMLTKESHDIDAALLQVRLNILAVFGVALAVTVLLSLYLAGTISRPIHRLAAAAERVRLGHHRQHTIPDFKGRNDEIGGLAAALREMTEALWQRMDAIEKFAADVAHEIKNPLTSLRSAVETVARIQDPEQQRKLMGIIQEDVQRLDMLLSDISNASRLDAELSRAETGAVDLVPMLSTLVDVYRANDAADAPKVRLEQSGDLVVDGMESRLAQVFHNLMINALSFSPPGGEITVRAVREEARVRVTVEDDGPGIPDGKEETIFERFYTERPKDEKFGTHSGLGLNISKQIVAAHGGEIRAENRRDETGRKVGARLIVDLPAD